MHIQVKDLAMFKGFNLEKTLQLHRHNIILWVTKGLSAGNMKHVIYLNIAMSAKQVELELLVPCQLPRLATQLKEMFIHSLCMHLTIFSNEVFQGNVIVND